MEKSDSSSWDIEDFSDRLKVVWAQEGGGGMGEGWWRKRNRIQIWHMHTIITNQDVLKRIYYTISV